MSNTYLQKKFHTLLKAHFEVFLYFLYSINARLIYFLFYPLDKYAYAYKLIFEYIETFYNTIRIHSHCGYLSPNEYEEQYLKKLEKYAVKIAS